MDITKLDPNLAPDRVHWEGMKTCDPNRPPFRLYGLCREPGETDYKRLPREVAFSMDNPQVRALYTNTAGIRLRFRTDSGRIVLRAALPDLCRFPHMPLTGTGCFDLYADGEFVTAMQPDRPLTGDGPVCYDSARSFPDRRMRDILIHFPLYNNVSQVLLGLDEDALILPPEPYKHETPVAYYGSSITQGGCASHGGNSYQAILSRRLHTDYRNFGFSGGCRGELALADYFATLEMSVFVLDYDHNAPSAAFLQETHEPFFRRFREKRPEVPVILISVADRSFGEETEARRDVIRRTYDRAVAAGDKNVYFLDGDTIYRDVGRGLCTVDGCHPNDLGFWCMANAIEKVLKPLL